MSRTPPSPDRPDLEWFVVGRGDGLLVGPRRAFASGVEVRASVRVDPSLDAQELGAVQRTVEVAESGLRTFTVTWHDDGDGGVVAVNPAGGNRVHWTSGSPTRLTLTPVDDDHLTSVRVRFLLRHLTTQLLATDLAGRPLHAVTGRLVTGTRAGGALAVAGPTRSGKTRLANRLTVAGVIDEATDDDCPVLLPDGRVATLIPRRYEVARARLEPLGGLVLLSETAEGVAPVAPQQAEQLLAGTPLPWPATWLPSTPLSPLPRLPAVPVVIAPSRDESCAAAVAAFMS